MGVDCHTCVQESRAVSKEELLVNVAVTDPLVAPLVAAARAVQSAYFAEDYIGRVSKRSGFRLTLLTASREGVPTLLGYVVYRFKECAISVAQLAIDAQFHGCGYGRKLVKWLVQEAKKNTHVEIIALSSLPTSTGFYQHFGFRRVKVQGISGEDYVEGQVYMEYRCRKPSKSRQRLQRSSTSKPDNKSLASDSTNDGAGSTTDQAEFIASSSGDEHLLDAAAAEITTSAPKDRVALLDVQATTQPCGVHKAAHEQADPVDTGGGAVSSVANSGPAPCTERASRWSLRHRSHSQVEDSKSSGRTLSQSHIENVEESVPEALVARRVWRAART